MQVCAGPWYANIVSCNSRSRLVHICIYLKFLSLYCVWKKNFFIHPRTQHLILEGTFSPVQPVIFVASSDSSQASSYTPPPLLLSASTHLTAPHQSSHLQPLLISFFASFSVLATASLISDRQFLHLVDGVPAHQDKVKDIYVFFSCHVKH